MIEDLNKIAEAAADSHNNSPLKQFDGLSPNHMWHVIYEPFSKMNPIRFREIDRESMARIPLLNSVKYLADMLDKQNEIKLTKKGFLPVKIVREIYNAGFLKDELIELEIAKIYKELDCASVHLTRIISELIPIFKKRHNKISLTKKGRKFLSDDTLLLREILKVFSVRFNWGYFDGYESESIGQTGFFFSLYLLNKYGDKRRPTKFYADKYLKAFPFVLEELEDNSFRSMTDMFYSCYEVRTFSRYLDRLGVVEIIKPASWKEDRTVKTNSLFKKLVECAV